MPDDIPTEGSRPNFTAEANAGSDPWRWMGTFGYMWAEALRDADPEVYDAFQRDGRLATFARLAETRIDAEYRARRNLLIRTRAIGTRASGPSWVDAIIGLLEQAREHALSVILPRRHEGPDVHSGGWDLEAACHLVSVIPSRHIEEPSHWAQGGQELTWLVTELEADGESEESLKRVLRRISSGRDPTA
jgi:hypothetical protein